MLYVSSFFSLHIFFNLPVQPRVANDVKYYVGHGIFDMFTHLLSHLPSSSSFNYIQTSHLVGCNLAYVDSKSVQTYKRGFLRMLSMGHIILNGIK